MSSQLYGVYGASGLGRQIMPIARASVSGMGYAKKSLVFIDDSPSSAVVNGHRVITYEEFLSESSNEKYVVIAVADGRVRELLFTKCENAGIEPWSLAAESSVVTDEVEIGSGYFLSHFSLLTCNINIGKCFQANHYAQVSHDCKIGDFVTLAPGARCNGNVHIGDYAYIGASAVIKQGQPSKPLRIGRGAIIGMGAVVTKDVPDGAVVVGNPARVSEPPLAKNQ